ncbi:hypothetical protein ACQ4PT_068125 [Festuca glaucescens]
MNPFAKKPTPREAIRNSKRELTNATRGIERDIGTLQQEQMDPAKQMKVMQEFQKQSAQMDMTNEMMSDSIDNILDDDQAEEETDELANQVLDEIGVDVASQLSSAPKGRIAGKKAVADDSSELDELEKRLAALKNP